MLDRQSHFIKWRGLKNAPPACIVMSMSQVVVARRHKFIPGSHMPID